MPSCTGANGYTSTTFAAPPGTAAATTANSSTDNPASGNISDVNTLAPSGTHESGTTTSTGPATPARPAGVDISNNARTDTDTPRPRNTSTNRTASNECPPSRKKSSSTPTRSSPRTSANTPHSNSSCGVAGPRDDPDPAI